MSFYYTPGNVPNDLQAPSYLILETILWGRLTRCSLQKIYVNLEPHKVTL